MQRNTTDCFQVEHIDYDRPFQTVVAALESATGDLTDGSQRNRIRQGRQGGL